MVAELSINEEIVMFDKEGNFTFSTFIPVTERIYLFRPQI